MSNGNNKTKSLWSEFASFKLLWPYLRKQKKFVFSALILIPVIALVQMAAPFIIKQTIDQGVAKGDYTQISQGALLFLLIIFAEYIARSGQKLVAGIAVQRMIRNLRQHLTKHTLNLPASYHDKTMSGALVTCATSDFDNLGDSLSKGVLGSVVDIVALIGSFIGLFLLHWQFGFFMLLLVPVIGGIVTVFTKILKRALLKARQKIGRLNAFTQECLYGNVTVKTLAAESSAQRKYQILNKDFRDAQMKSVIFDALLYSVIDGTASVTLGVVLWAAVSPILGNQGLTAGLLIAMVAYIQRIFEPLKELSNKIAMLQGSFTSMDRIFGILNINEKISGNLIPKQFNGEINFKNVSFSYLKDDNTQKNDQKAVLRNVSFNVKAGKSLAIVGATGSGKSTIIKLISKLYDGFKGTITFDGKNLKKLNPDYLRQQMAIVPQDIILFDGSIDFNISLADKNISQDIIHQAARQVGADSFIDKLPGKYRFHIKEQGDNLSQGQRQLITFARALAKNPKIIVLDEATSSVDPKSEEMIQKATESLLKDRTVIVIAHRLSTIRQCDSILVLDKGMVLEQGTHKELLKKKKHYYALHNSQ